MADPEDPAREEAEQEGTPRWVKVFAAVALLAVLLALVVVLAGGGHGPGRHAAPAAKDVATAA